MSRVTQTASHWGVYNVTTDDKGDVVRTTPLEMDRHPARYVSSLPELVRSPLRIDQPFVRAGFLTKAAAKKRGGDSFVPVSWDHALDLVAEELRRVKGEFGNQAIYGGADGWASAGRLHHAPTLVRRFLGLHGGFVDKRGNHSFGAALTVMPYVIGRADIPNLVVPWESIVGTTELMVMFGGAAGKNMQTSYGGAVLHENPDWFARAAAAGIEFVNISPSRQNLDERVRTDWIPIRPNTDVALMLALAHTLVVNGLHDRAFLDRYCEGYEVFERYLLGSDGEEARDAQWAASVTGVPADTIVALAKRMAQRRTLITASWSIQRADHGEQPVWMTVVLAAMLGQIGKPGCGFSIGFGAENGGTKTRRSDVPRPAMAVGANAVSAFIPVGLAAEMILNPGQTFDYNGIKITAPDIRLIYAAGGNPFHHNTNLNRFLQAWQRPETIIVHEAFWNPAARHADIVLPATTTLERNDIQAGDMECSWVAMHKVFEPVDLARNDFDILADLAGRLGFGQAFTEGRDEMGWLRHMYDSARKRAHNLGVNPPDFEAFWTTGMFEFPKAAPGTLLGEFIADPVQNPLRTASGKIEIFSAKIAGYGYDDCTPHPAWIEPAEWLGSPLARRFPLHLLSNQPTTRLHSQLDPASASRNSKVNGREPIAMHPADAAARRLVDSDVVRVFNDRGSFLAGLVIADYLTPGVVQIATGAWYDPLEGGVPGTLEKHGNPNVVTINKSASRLSHAPAAQTVLVEIEKAPSAVPEVTAFERPSIRLAHD
jgi:biotin/methionine sulfoxide reductase